MNLYRIIYLLLLLLVAVTIFFFIYRRDRDKLSRGAWIVVAVLFACALFISLSVSASALPKRMVTITATGQKNERSHQAELNLKHINVNGDSISLPTPVSGRWVLYEGNYRWFVPGDERDEPGSTPSVTFQFHMLDNVEFIFDGNEWKGIAEITADGKSTLLDTFREKGTKVSFTVPQPPVGPALRAVALGVAIFAASLLGLCALVLLLLRLCRRLGNGLLATLSQRGPFRKLLSNQFLFEELVSRDFKKKYKRTVLGMLWSILSPLLTLLVMRLVFTQFFGRNTAHYTIYLFCGNLVYSYFNESTSQGMTSLVSNAAIFTKVNVPKYLFLFSKNVQTLINFGLTLVVFFIFCILDNITFTWRFVLLLYPIVMLLLFNIGVGLILSALFVFFKDIQYLWSVFTLLLMYMSAIFYNIDGYAPMIQNLFLINPVYLFIRYFRKIVIEATIPSPWFHLLMLADVIVVVGLGCWMYKKNNTKFLYYV